MANTNHSTISDYIGRKVDLAAWQDTYHGNRIAMTPGFAVDGEGGRAIAGIKKLAQWFLFELLLERGSMLYDPDRGCDFMRLARIGALRTQLDVEQAFFSALIDIRRNLRDRETDDSPDDERYGSAELLSVFHTPGDISLSVRLTSLSGESREFLFPITTVLQAPIEA